jgi:class 3 adenylate cyclase
VPACAQCGEQNPPEARLCWSCGTALPGRRRAGEERRLVTVLFVDLVGFTGLAERLDPEDLKRLVSPYLGRVRAEAERFGGTVEKYIGDAVMALFGAPVAHGDDAERAVRAAFAIRDAVAGLKEGEGDVDLRVRIGVSTGEAFLDLAADPAAGEGMASGDVVVTAFRLQQSAPAGGIVVGEATYRATERVVEYAELESVAAKGKQEPVRAWSAAALRTGGGRPRVALVGRDTELGRLRALVVSAERSRPGASRSWARPASESHACCGSSGRRSPAGRLRSAGCREGASPTAAASASRRSRRRRRRTRGSSRPTLRTWSRPGWTRPSPPRSRTTRPAAG